jgi:hypothetical protein
MELQQFENMDRSLIQAVDSFFKPRRDKFKHKNRLSKFVNKILGKISSNDYANNGHSSSYEYEDLFSFRLFLEIRKYKLIKIPFVKVSTAMKIYQKYLSDDSYLHISYVPRSLIERFKIINDTKYDDNDWLIESNAGIIPMDELESLVLKYLNTNVLPVFLESPAYREWQTRIVIESRIESLFLSSYS